MAVFHTRNIIWRGAPFLRHLYHILGRHVQELGLRIDEARDQPRTGDAVDLRALARDPFHGYFAAVAPPAAFHASMPPSMKRALTPWAWRWSTTELLTEPPRTQ